jgi:hypothetical protein
MAKPNAKVNAIKAFRKDMKLVKRAARIAAMYYLCNAAGQDNKAAVLKDAAAYSDTQFATGSDAKSLFLSLVNTMADLDWEVGQHTDVISISATGDQDDDEGESDDADTGTEGDDSDPGDEAQAA